MRSLHRHSNRGTVLLILLLLAACSPPGPSETPAVQQTQTATARIAPTQQAQETIEALPTTTSTSLPPPTPALPPGPLDPGAISPENVKEVIELARWGDGTARGIFYSPDGGQVALNTALGVYLYEAESLSQSGFFPAASAAYSAAFSPDWSTLAWGEGNSVRLLRTADGAALLTIGTEAGKLADLKFSPDGSLLALQVRPPGEEVYTHLVELRQVSDGSLLNTWDMQGMSWAFSPDWGSMAAWNGRAGLQLWQLPSGQPLPFPGESGFQGESGFLLESGMISTAAFSPDGTLLASAGSPAGKVQLWQPGDGTLLRSLEGENLEITGLAFSPDGRVLAGADRKGATHLWRAADGTRLLTFPSGSGGNDLIAFSPDGSELALTSNQGFTFWRATDGAALRHLENHPGPIRQMAFNSANGTVAALAGNPPSDSSFLTLWRLSERRPFFISEPVEVLSMDLSPQGSTLALGMWDGTVQMLQTADGQLSNTLTGHPAQVQSVAFSPDGSSLASSSMEEVRLWSAQDGQLLHRLPAPGGWVTGLAFSPDGGLLASFSGDGSVRLWQVSDGRPVGEVLSAPEAGWEGGLSFAPDGSTLALGTHLSALIWQVPGGSPVKTLALSAPATTGMAFSPDGALLAAGLSDGSIEIWKPEEDQAVHSLTGHTDSVTGLSFSEDGLFLVSASLDGTLRLWGLSGAR